jgi:hypothetical protein
MIFTTAVAVCHRWCGPEAVADVGMPIFRSIFQEYSFSILCMSFSPNMSLANQWRDVGMCPHLLEASNQRVVLACNTIA